MLNSGTAPGLPTTAADAKPFTIRMSHCNYADGCALPDANQITPTHQGEPNMESNITRDSGLELTRLDDKRVTWQYQSAKLGLRSGYINYQTLLGDGGWVITGFETTNLNLSFPTHDLFGDAVAIIEMELQTLEETTDASQENRIKDQLDEFFGD